MSDPERGEDLLEAAARAVLADDAPERLRSVETTTATLAESSLAEIAQESSANAATESGGSIRGGEMRAVGFATARGYELAIRKGVPMMTHLAYLDVLRSRFGYGPDAIAALSGPMRETDLPVGPGLTHVPTGVPLFDRPPEERRLLVGDRRVVQSTAANAPAAPRPVPASAPKPPSRVRPTSMSLRAGDVPVRRRPDPPKVPALTVPAVAARAILSKIVQTVVSAAGDPVASGASGEVSTARRAPDRVAQSSGAGADDGDAASARFALLELD